MSEKRFYYEDDLPLDDTPVLEEIDDTEDLDELSKEFVNHVVLFIRTRYLFLVELWNLSLLMMARKLQH
jgi:hypothetical protein